MYFIDNLFPALTNPGEWYQFPNGTIYYWPEADDNIEASETYFSDQGIGIHTAKRHNILVENVEIYYMSGHGFYISEASNITVRNVTVKHCGNGFSTNGYDGLIEDSLFEDIGGYAGRFHSTKNVTLQNCIMRRLTRTTYDSGGIYIPSSNNHNLNILNNDISGSYSAPIFASGNSKYDLETVKNITIKDNHIHHAGLNVMDDFGGVQGLALPNGLIIDHNWIHDMNAAKSIGNGMFVGTGIAGVIMKNNLVHDISHDAMKMDHGVNITLHNNILAYANYMMTWTKYVENSFTFNIDNNIFDNQYIYIMTGPWANQVSNYYIDKNIYWHQSDTSKLSWVYKTFEKWQEIGNDLKSFVTDPLFVDADKRDFNFRSKEAYEKIGFKPFSMTFGVIGEKWRETADNFKQEEPYGTPINSPIKGNYSFEDDEEENIVKMVTSLSKSEISTDKKVGDGSKSLKMQSTGGKKIDQDRPNVATTLNWNEGIGEFSLMIFTSEGTRVHFDMNFGTKFIIENGKMSFDKTEIGTVPNDQWFELKVVAGYGNDNDGTINVSVNGNRPVEIKVTYKNSPQALFEVVNSTSNVYIDKINAKLNCKDLDYFEDFAKDEEETLVSSSSSMESADINDENAGDDVSTEKDGNEGSAGGNNEENENNDNSKKKKSTTIAIVVVVVIIVIAAVVGVVIYFIFKKRKDNDSEILELNE